MPGCLVLLFVLVFPVAAQADQLSEQVKQLAREVDGICNNLKTALGEKFDSNACPKISASFIALYGATQNLDTRLNTIEARLSGVKASTGAAPPAKPNED